MRPKSKALSFVIIFVAALAMLHFGSARGASSEPRGVCKLTMHYGASADWFDPSTSGTPRSMPMMYLFHDALIKSMPGNWYAPCLAESWKISPDYKIYEFKLRKGVKFHNGDPMTAEDVLFTFQRYKGLNAKMILGRIEKLEAVDPYLFRVTFKEPFLDFIDYFLRGMSSIGWVVPKKYIERVGDAAYRRQPVGCGPYKFVEFSPNVKFVGEAFADYWRKVPNVKRMEYYIVQDQSARYAMVKNGEVDFSLQLTDIIYEKLKKDTSLRLLTSLSANYNLIHMTSQYDPKSPWSDPRVRKAASLALDRKTIRDVDRPGVPIIGSIALDGDPDGVSFPPDPYDPERARKLLAEAGYPKGFHGGKFYAESGFWNYGDMVANFWKAVGISVESVNVESATRLSMRAAKKLKDAVFLDPTGATTIAGRLEYFWEGAFCYGPYPDIQDLWDKYNKSIDPKARKDLVGRIQRIIHEKTMVIPVTGSGVITAATPRLKGDPFKVEYCWWPAPVEDLELNE